MTAMFWWSPLQIRDVVLRMDDSHPLFIMAFGHIAGIVTSGDLQKAPVRMRLFALVSLLEMQLLRVLRLRLSDEDLPSKLKPVRVEAIEKLYSERAARNEAIDRMDCLQFCDKRVLLSADKQLVSELGFQNTTDFVKKMEEIERLRNDLAHGQSVITPKRPRLSELMLLLEAAWLEPRESERRAMAGRARSALKGILSIRPKGKCPRGS